MVDEEVKVEGEEVNPEVTTPEVALEETPEETVEVAPEETVEAPVEEVAPEVTPEPAA